MKELDLEEALSGKPVLLRNGCKAYICIDLRKQEGVYSGGYPFLGFYIEKGRIFGESWRYDGSISEYGSNCVTDIIGMWVEPRPTVTLTLPAPLKKPLKNMWYISKGDDFADLGFLIKQEDPVTCEPTLLENGLYFASKEDAQAWVEAFKNSRI